MCLTNYLEPGVVELSVAATTVNQAGAALLLAQCSKLFLLTCSRLWGCSTW